MLGDEQYKALMHTLQTMGDKADQTSKRIGKIEVSLAVVKERIAGFVTLPEMMLEFRKHVSECPLLNKKSSSSLTRPPAAGGVSWPQVFKYTGVLISVLSAGIAIGKLLL